MYQKNEDEYTDVYVDEKEEPKAQYKHTISSKIAWMMFLNNKDD